MPQSVVIDRIEEAVGLLVDGCARLEPEAVEPADITRLHGLLTRAERLAAGGRTRLARRVADAPDATTGPTGAAGFIARQTGTSLADARRQMKTSEDLPHLPHLDDALGAGQISTAQVNAIIPGVLANPDAEAELVNLAKDGTTDLADLRRRARKEVADADPDPESTRARHHARRAYRDWIDEHGEWHARINGPGEAGAAFRAAFKKAADEAFRAANKEGRREAPEAYAFDGLLATLTQPTADTPESGRARERKVIGIVDVVAVRRGTLQPGDRCDLNGVGPVSLGAMRDLIGSATAAILFRDGTTDLAVAHLGRQPTAFQRTALEARGYVCAVKGCGRTRNLEIDHVREWASTHETHVADLDWLCQLHHDAKTRGLIRLSGPPGNRTAHPITERTRHPADARAP